LHNVFPTASLFQENSSGQNRVIVLDETAIE
jgi:hypothetical protein